MGLFRTKKNGSIFLSRHIEEFYKPKLDAKNSSKAEGGMIDEILQKIPLTEKDPVCYILQFFGFMLARVLCTDTVAGLDLDPILFKYFKGSSLTWEDSATLAPSFFKTCSYLNSKTVTSDDELSFTVPIKILKHDKKVVEMFKLKEKQEDITQVNKEEYLQLYFQKKYVDPIVKYLDAVKTGFLMCFPSEFVDGLSPQELKFAVCGTQVVTLDDIKKYSKLPSSGNTNDAIMKQFWTTMGKLNSEQLKKFLYFISGNSHIPYNFSGNFNISVSTTKNRAPTASTCSYSGTFYACDTQELFDKLFFCAIEGGHWGYDQSF